MYSPEQREQIVDHVCDQIAQKRTLYKVLAEDANLPSLSSFLKWQSEDRELLEKVERAREHAASAYVAEMVDIADDREDDPDASSRKVRIYAREKAAQMIAPRRYGAKLDVTSAGEKLEAPVTTVLVDNRVQSLLAIANEAKRTDAIKRDLLDD